MTRLHQPLSLAEAIERRDAFLRHGVPLDFIQSRIAWARRQRNREMAEATRALVGLLKKSLLQLRWRSAPPALRRHA